MLIITLGFHISFVTRFSHAICCCQQINISTIRVNQLFRMRFHFINFTSWYPIVVYVENNPHSILLIEILSMIHLLKRKTPSLKIHSDLIFSHKMAVYKRRERSVRETTFVTWGATKIRKGDLFCGKCAKSEMEIKNLLWSFHFFDFRTQEYISEVESMSCGHLGMLVTDYGTNWPTIVS